jgi:phage repressor protein C with HTH and peptisase S24 domain
VNIEMGSRLKAERQRVGVAPTEFAVQCGVSRTSQFNYEAGERPPDAEYLQRAHEAGVDVHYVITGKKAEVTSSFVVVDQYDVAASAGPGTLNGSEDYSGGLSFSRQWLAKRGLHPSSLKVINVSGESMLPRLSDGDKVLVDISDTSPKSGRAYVLLQGDELLVKYCQLLPDGLLRVSSANSDYPTYDIDLSKTHGVSIVGRVRASTHEW